MTDFTPTTIEALRESRFRTALTGAGVSAESGIPTFRGEDGLWRTYRAENLATPDAFASHPEIVWEWYRWRRSIISKAEPNAAHHALVDLERLSPEFLLITQNVDNLHRRAGSTKIVELHGNIFRDRCAEEGIVSPAAETGDDTVPLCRCGGLLRPDVVWFGEVLPREALEEAFDAARRCDLMLVVGTSAFVQPAASLPIVAKQSGAYVVEINKDPTPLTGIVDDSILGSAGEVLPHLVARLSDAAEGCRETTNDETTRRNASTDAGEELCSEDSERTSSQD